MKNKPLGLMAHQLTVQLQWQALNATCCSLRNFKPSLSVLPSLPVTLSNFPQCTILSFQLSQPLFMLKLLAPQHMHLHYIILMLLFDNCALLIYFIINTNAIIEVLLTLSVGTSVFCRYSMLDVEKDELWCKMYWKASWGPNYNCRKVEEKSEENYLGIQTYS